MPVAAVPQYLGTDFSSAAPGHRFGMYLRLWGVDAHSKENLWTTHDLNYRTAGPRREERQFKDENKAVALAEALKLNTSDYQCMSALGARQDALAGALENGQLFCLAALATAPFTTGLGNEHPLENGFAFLNPYGLPYLPGSGVKGVLRRAAQELEQGLFGGTAGWTADAIDALFGVEADDGKHHRRGALSFWDVIPQIKGDSLRVDVMTPHQSHYYQKGESPHDSGSPNPIPFLTVPPGSGFSFYVQCKTTFLNRIAPDLATDSRWKTLLQAAFEHAYDWLGFGAKTAVGYGAMSRDAAAEQAREEARNEREERARLEAEEARRQAELAKLSPVDRKIEEAKVEGAKNNLKPEIAVFQALSAGQFDDEDRRNAAEKLKTMMEAAKVWKPTSNKPQKDKEHKRTIQVMKWLAE